MVLAENNLDSIKALDVLVLQQYELKICPMCNVTLGNP